MRVRPGRSGRVLPQTQQTSARLLGKGLRLAAVRAKIMGRCRPKTCCRGRRFHRRMPARHGRADPAGRRGPRPPVDPPLLRRCRGGAAGVEPCGRKDHRGGEELRARQAAAAAGQGLFVCGQAPARIEGLAEDAGAVPGEDRLEPHLRGDGVDGDGTFQQFPRRDGSVQQGDIGGQGGRVEMAGAQAEAGFGMGLDQDAGAGVIFPRLRQHGPEGGGRGAGMADGGIAARLIDQQDIAGGRRGRSGSWILYFDRSEAFKPRYSILCAGKKVRIIQGMGGRICSIKDGAAASKCTPERVDQQAERRVALTAGAEGAQKGILDPDQRRAAAGGRRFAPPCGGGPAPDHHAFAGAGRPGQIMPCQRQGCGAAAGLRKPPFRKRNRRGTSPAVLSWCCVMTASVRPGGAGQRVGRCGRAGDRTDGLLPLHDRALR
jgi:hypothetical protein